jgi:hypothetical protein
MHLPIDVPSTELCPPLPPKQILKRINAVITRRIAEGAALPPPPRTAIAGPEYFGLNDAATIAAIEALDPQHLCTIYWLGKQQR